MHSFTRLGLGLALLPILALAPGCSKKQDTSAPDSRALGTSYAEEAAPAEYASGEDRRRSSRARGGSSSTPAGAFEPASPSADGAWDSRDFEADEIAAEVSPGLGTAYGETRRSSVETVGFRRADPSTPDVVFSIRYDDTDGVRSAARNKRTRAFRDDAMQQQGGLAFALLDPWQGALEVCVAGAWQPAAPTNEIPGVGRKILERETT